MGYDHIGHPKGDFKYAYTGKMSPFEVNILIFLMEWMETVQEFVGIKV